MCVTAIGGALGAMYFIDRNVKKNEGVASPYSMFKTFDDL